MRNTIRILLTGIFLMSFAGGQVFALTAGEIVEKANQATYYQGKDGSSDVHMVITDSQSRTRERDMSILRFDQDNGSDQKYFVYFHKPNDVKGMSYLVWKNPGKDDDRWLYLPALDLVRRVAASDKRSSFVGSHFAYEEISGRSTEEDEHELIEDAQGYYRIKSVPKAPGSVEFSYFITTIGKDNFIPEKAEMYDKNGKLYKTIEALEVRDVQGYPTVTKMKATDLNSNGTTVSEFKNIKFDVGLDDGIFSERYLRRPPQQYMNRR